MTMAQTLPDTSRPLLARRRRARDFPVERAGQMP